MLYGSPRNVAYATDKRSVLNVSCEHAAQRFHFMAETMPQKIFTATANGDVDVTESARLEREHAAAHDRHGE